MQTLSTFIHDVGTYADAHGLVESPRQHTLIGLLDLGAPGVGAAPAQADGDEIAAWFESVLADADDVPVKH